ncbi:MAG: hypothetical protein WA921_05595 [Ahrensia sp.]
MRDVSSPFSSRRARIRELQTLLAKMGIEVELGHEAVARPADLVVATSWRTAFDVAACNAPRKAYFIQDYEPWFYPHGDQYLKAEQSYRLGLTPIVLGRWLAQKVGGLSSITPFVMPFTVDRQVYARETSPRRSKAICYLHQPEKPRRCAALAQTTLRIVQERRPDIAICSYGSVRAPELPTRHLGVQSRQACAKLYNQASVGLCISASNPSRIPFEMAACGLPVVDIDAENTREDALPHALLLTPADPASLAAALIRAVDAAYYENLTSPLIDGNQVEFDELDTGALAFRQILLEPPVHVSVQTAAVYVEKSHAWQRLRRRLIKSYIAFFED